MIDAKTLRKMRRFLYEENKRQPHQLTRVSKSEWPDTAKRVSMQPDQVFRSKQYLVQVFDEPNGVKRLSICRAELDENGHYKDGLTWNEIQSIKSQCGFWDYDAVEIYPSDDSVVNVANMRHIWVLPEKFHLTWRGK